jgi:branched-chain amino acid transport system ATP-binding protein
MLKAKGIDVYYDDIQILYGVSLDVQKREIVALLGPNGCGKSTTIKSLSMILRPRAGDVFFEETNLYEEPTHRIVELGLVHVPEARRIFSNMSVEENLLIGSFCRSARQNRATNLSRVFSTFPVLKERRKQMGGTLSGGEQQMLAIGRGLMASPKLMMLDEPSLGLAPILVDAVFSIIRRIRDEGVTVLLVEQNVKLSLAMSDRVYVLENGRIVLEGCGRSMLETAAIKEAYLGL